MESEKLIANTVGDKTARACDNCITRRARWYCAADDAFLCQTCDGLIHSANLLARRHERVRLKAASITVLQVPSWHNGFTRKPRTPRQQKHQRQVNKSDKLTTNPLHVVPEMVQHNDNLFEQNEEQEELIYSVPIFDPFTVDHEEFEADIVENILRKGLDDEESFDMETLGFLDCPEMDNSVESSSTWGSTGKVIKFEAEEEMKDSRNVNYQIEAEIDMTRETFELNFDDYEEDDEKVGGVVGSVIDQLKEECEVMDINVEEKKNNILLALDYDGVLAAWPEQKSAWMTGDQPEVEHSSCWPDCMGECEKIHEKYPITYGEMGENRMLDGGREARVSRYREKRRSRLFSKKIRYEVRKLNAEKRPRIKGRFVKRANFVAVN